MPSRAFSHPILVVDAAFVILVFLGLAEYHGHVLVAQELPVSQSNEANDRARAKRLATLILQTRSENRKTRLEAVSNIGAMGPAAQSAIPVLIELFDGDAGQRSYVRSALVKIGKNALPAVKKALTHSSPNVRIGAARTLDYIGEDAKSAIPDVVAMLNDPVRVVRWEVCDVLGVFGDAQTVDHLIRIMKTDKEKSVRGVAANAVARLTGRLLADSPKAKASVRAVLECMKNEKISPQDAEALSLAGKAAVPEMLTLLEDAETTSEYREVAFQVLWNIDEENYSAADLQRVVQLIDDPAQDTRCKALWIVGAKAVGNSNAARSVERALKDKSALVRVDAAECLYLITGRIKLAIAVLVTEMMNPDASVREAACMAVCEFGADGTPAVPGLIMRLNDENHDVCFQAIRALREIGPGAKAAQDELKRIADGDSRLSKLAKDALKEIRRHR